MDTQLVTFNAMSGRTPMLMGEQHAPMTSSPAPLIFNISEVDEDEPDITNAQDNRQSTSSRATLNSLIAQINLQDSLMPAPPRAASHRCHGWLPWRRSDVAPGAVTTFLPRTQLGSDREGLLMDHGAHDNLAGIDWVKRMTLLLERQGFGQRVKWRKLPVPLKVAGVGSNSQRAEWCVSLPIAVNGHFGEYTAPVVGDDANPCRIPALWGLKSITSNRTVTDMINKKVYMCGPGDVAIIAPPGTIIIDLEQAPSSHAMVPCSDFNKVDLNNKSVSFQVDVSTCPP